MTTNLKSGNLPRNSQLIKKIGNRISIIRNVRGFLLEKFSEMTKIPVKDLGEYEAGNRDISVDDLVVIAGVLEIGAFHFFL
jgi:hypothetical protein